MNDPAFNNSRTSNAINNINPKDLSPLISTKKITENCLWLGTITYQEGKEIQNYCLNLRRSQKTKDILLLLEHYPVITIGKRPGAKKHLLKIPELIEKKGIEIIATDRGGDITFHNPGQLIGYPIVNLRERKLDVHQFFRLLEDMLIEVLEPLDIKAERREAYTGVWVKDQKIASIGIAVKQGITQHGFALNVNNSLEGFGFIVPCGIAGVKMTSLKQILDNNIQIADLLPTVAQAWHKFFT